MSLVNGYKIFGCAATAVAATIGLMITPAPAKAYPPLPLRPENECYHSAAGYQFPGGEVVIVYPDTGAKTRFNAPQGTHVDAPAETFYENGTSLKGRVTGDVTKGGNVIDLTVTRGPEYPPLHVQGAVQPNNTPGGEFFFDNGGLRPWKSPTQLACVPGAPVNDPLPQQNPAPQPAAPAQPVQPAPAAEPAPAPPVTNAIALSFGQPGLGSITATVTNSSGLTGKCTYDAAGLTKTHRDFTVGANASTNLTFNGLNTGTSYHVVVSCHDASGKQTQEIGHAEQNVTF